MRKLSMPRLIIRFVFILLVVAALLYIGVILTPTAATDKNIDFVPIEEPPLTETEAVTLVFEPIEYDIPLETKQEPIEENEGESTEITTEEVDLTIFDGSAAENTNVVAIENSLVVEPEVTTPISETILIDFSEEVWEEAWIASDQYDEEIQMIAKVMLLEAGGIAIDDHKAAIAWTVLNRVDAGYGPTIASVIIPGQFAYNPDVMIRTDLYLLVKDVVTRWMLEKQGYINVGRVLPSDYLWYWGDGEFNWFRNIYEDGSNPWLWEYPSPY